MSDTANIDDTIGAVVGKVLERLTSLEQVLEQTETESGRLVTAADGLQQSVSKNSEVAEAIVQLATELDGLTKRLTQLDIEALDARMQAIDDSVNTGFQNEADMQLRIESRTDDVIEKVTRISHEITLNRKLLWAAIVLATLSVGVSVLPFFL